MQTNRLPAALDAFLAERETELAGFRRDLHAHPEPGFAEYRTTRRIAERLAAAGLRPVILPKGTGLLADINPADMNTGRGSRTGRRAANGSGMDAINCTERTVVTLRADIDALPMADEKEVPYRSTVPGVCHACGHDVHATILLGTGLFLARQAEAGLLPGRVRLIFQPGEETATGAQDVIAAGGLASVARIFGLHCDPRLDVGKLGVRTGPITAACDKIQVTVSGPGGHTARPHLTADVVYALGKIVTELPAALSRLVDPRSGLSLVWGRISAGSMANAIPNEGTAEGTVRCLDGEAWRKAPGIVEGLVRSVAAAYGVTAEVSYLRYVPPTVNEPVSAGMLAAAAEAALGPGSVATTEQSLGGEDFAWYLESVPGALARLGTRTPGSDVQHDLHQSAFDVDERAIGIGVRVLATAALGALHDGTASTSTAGTAGRAVGPAAAEPLAGGPFARELFTGKPLGPEPLGPEPLARQAG